MAAIDFTVSSSFLPIGVELRQGTDKTGTLVNSTVVETAGTYSFTGITSGTYVVVAYDVASGVKVSTPVVIP